MDNIQNELMALKAHWFDLLRQFERVKAEMAETERRIVELEQDAEPADEMTE